VVLHSIRLGDGGRLHVRRLSNSSYRRLLVSREAGKQRRPRYQLAKRDQHSLFWLNRKRLPVCKPKPTLELIYIMCRNPRKRENSSPFQRLKCCASSGVIMSFSKIKKWCGELLATIISAGRGQEWGSAHYFVRVTGRWDVQ